MRVRRLWGLLAAAMLLAACSGSSTGTADPPTPPSTSTVTPPEVTTTTGEIVSTTTTVQEPEVLLPANDVDDPTEAMVAILDYVSYLHTIPDRGADYLDLVYLETCDCYEAVRGFLADYTRRGYAQDDDGIEVHEVILSQEVSAGNVLLQVTESWSPQYVLDRDGNRLRLVADEFVNKVIFLGLELGNDQRWRVAVTGRLGEISEASNS